MSFHYQAMDFLENYVSPYVRYGLVITGHSLGAALAQLIPVMAGYPQVVCAFNSPGIGHLPGIDLSVAGYIHNINSHYGFINKIGKVIGRIDSVGVPNEEKQAKVVFDLLKQNQAIEKEVDVLEKDKSHILRNSFAVDGLEKEEFASLNIMAFNFLESVYPQHSMDNLQAALLNNYLAHEFVVVQS